MLLELLKSKIHRVRVTGADLNYIGSITIDRSLMAAAQLVVHQLPVERKAKRQAAQRLAGALQGALVMAGKGGSGHALAQGDR